MTAYHSPLTDARATSAGSGYSDDPHALLALMRRVHEDHPEAFCFGGTPGHRHDATPTSPETVRLVPKAKATGLWGDPLPDDEREFQYAYGVRCQTCGADLSEALAIYGPRCEFPEGWRGPTVKLATPLEELVLYAD